MSLKEKALEIFNHALKSVLPENLIKDKIKIEKESLCIEKDVYPLNSKFYIFGSGKASVSMAKALEKHFFENIKDGVVVSNYIERLNKIKVLEGSHPVPTQKSIDATKEIVRKMKSLKEDDFFIYLLSGGSSALLEQPIEPITIDDLKKVTDIFLKRSIPIDELNIVRKHLSMVKGGRLAQIAKAKGVVLVISDVIGDDLETIGSAPLYMDKTTYEDAYNICKKYSVLDELPKSVKIVIEEGLKKEIKETPKTPPKNIKHYIIGNNSYLLKKAKEKAKTFGFNSYIMTSSLHGEAKEIAKAIFSIANEIKKSENPFKKPVCLLFGGETTVTVAGDGKGGRCQEMALSALKEIKNLDRVVFLAAGTDGIDGNSDADGALIDRSDYIKAKNLGLNIDEYLKNSDSYHFFKKTGSLLFTGKTGTNVMDIQILIVE